MRKLTEEVEKLEMYPERKQVFNILISKEQDDGLVKLADCLCNQYKQFYIKCKGKDAYLNFQIQWVRFPTLHCIWGRNKSSQKTHK